MTTFMHTTVLKKYLFDSKNISVESAFGSLCENCYNVKTKQYTNKASFKMSHMPQGYAETHCHGGSSSHAKPPKTT